MGRPAVICFFVDNSPYGERLFLNRVPHKCHVSGGVICLFTGLFSVKRRHAVEQFALAAQERHDLVNINRQADVSEGRDG